MANDLGSLMSDGLAAPLGDVIEAVGRGVAEAQAALDAGSMSATLALYDEGGDALVRSFREIGYRPTFYALAETQCEMQVSLRIGGIGAPDGSAGPRSPSRSALYVTPVDAGFANRYAYSVEASAKLSFKIVPVPPPGALDDLRPVPTLVGRAPEQALTVLQSLGFVVLLRDRAGDPVDPGRSMLLVQAQEPAALALARVGSTVTLTLGS